jgi:gluconolactonase
MMSRVFAMSRRLLMRRAFLMSRALSALMAVGALGLAVPSADGAAKAGADPAAPRAATAGVKVLNDDASYPEGPVWHDGKLYYVEYGRDAVTVWDGRTNQRFWSQPGCGQSAVIDTSRGDFLTTCFDSGTIGRFDGTGKTLAPYAHDQDGNRFLGPNDFAPDGTGGIYFTASGTMGHGPVTDGKVFYIAPDETITQKITGLHNANGIAVSKDRKTLYVVETDANRLLQFDIAADGSLSGRRVFVNLDDLTGHRVHIWPDGVKIDSRGEIYIGQSPRALHVPLAGTLFVVDSHAHLLRTLVLPSLQVPNLAFSPDEKTLYVAGVDELDKPYRGKLYSIPNQ